MAEPDLKSIYGDPRRRRPGGRKFQTLEQRYDLNDPSLKLPRGVSSQGFNTLEQRYDLTDPTDEEAFYGIRKEKPTIRQRPGTSIYDMPPLEDPANLPQTPDAPWPNQPAPAAPARPKPYTLPVPPINLLPKITDEEKAFTLGLPRPGEMNIGKMMEKIDWGKVEGKPSTGGIEPLPKATPVGGAIGKPPLDFDHLSQVFKRGDAEREKKLSRLEGQKDLASGLGQMGQVTTGAMIRSGVKAPAFTGTAGLEKEIGRTEDTLTDAERQMIQDNFDVILPPGARRSQVEAVIGPLTDLRKAGMATAATMAREGRMASESRERLERAQRTEERAQRTEERTGKIEERKQRNEEKGLRMMARPSNDQAKDILTIDKTLALLEKIKAGKGEINTGPLIDNLWSPTSWVPRAAETLGFNEERAGFRARLAGVINAYINQVTGAAASVPEMKRIMQAMPSMSDDDSSFMKKMGIVLKDLQDYRDQVLENLTAQGKDVESFRGLTPKAEPRKTGEGGKIPVYDPETKEEVGEVWPEELEEARSRGAVTAEELEAQR